MPVLVTAAHHPLARRIAARLLEEGGEVRAFTSGDAASLRAAGAFVASGGSDDEGRLEAALEGVHTVVHVGGGLGSSDPGRIVEDAEVLARAATGAQVRRIVTLSPAGSSPSAADPIRAAKGIAEQVLAGVPCPTIVLRLGLVDTPALRDALVTAGFGPDVLEVEVAPVGVRDVLELVAAFDRARSSSPQGHLVVSADGPRRMSVAGYLDQVTPGGFSGASRMGRRIPDPATVERVSALLRGPWRSPEDGLVDGWAFADFEPVGLVPVTGAS